MTYPEENYINIYSHAGGSVAYTYTFNFTDGVEHSWIEDGTDLAVPFTPLTQDELGFTTPANMPANSIVIAKRVSDNEQSYTPEPRNVIVSQDIADGLNSLQHQITENRGNSDTEHVSVNPNDAENLIPANHINRANRILVYDVNGEFVETGITYQNLEDVYSDIEQWKNEAEASAIASANSATDSANSATASANSATASADSSTDSANSASASATSAGQAFSSAQTADEHQQDAQLYRDQAMQFAGSADQSATDSADSASQAQTHSNDAADAAIQASDSEAQAQASATNASNSASAAATSAQEASDARDDVIEIATLVPTNGFDRTDTNSMGTIGFDSVQRIASIGPKSGQSEFAFWTNGTKFELTSEQTVQIPNTTGAYYVYFDNSGTLKQQNITQLTGQMFYEFAPVSFVYWNETQQSYLFGDERHGISMASATHIALHQGFGSQYHSGLDIQGLVAGNSTYTGITDGSFADEDITHVIQNVTDSQIMYRLGASGEWTFETPDNSIGIKESGDTYFSWNEFNGSEWVLSEGTLSTDYFTTFFIATPSVDGPGITRIIGQTAYSSPKEAKAGVIDEVNTITLGGLPSPEFVFLYAVVIDRNGNVQEIDSEGSVLYDLRENKGGASGISASAANHKDLANVDSAATGVADGHVDNSKPLQLPELTNAEILAWATPTVGLTVVDTTNDDVLSWDGTEWKSVFGGGETIVDDYGNIIPPGSNASYVYGGGSNSNLILGYSHYLNDTNKFNILTGNGSKVSNGKSNILAGSDNEVTQYSDRNIMNGYSNYCGYNSSNNILSGRSNRAQSSFYSHMIGTYNNLNNYGVSTAIVGDNITANSANKSMIIGDYHNISSIQTSLLVGQKGVAPGYYNSITTAGGDYYGNVHQNSQLTVGQHASGTGYTSLPINGSGVPSGANRLFKITTLVATHDPSPGDADFVYEHFITLYNDGSTTQIMGTTSNAITVPTPGIVNFLFGLNGNALTMSVSSSWAPFHVGTKLDIITIN